MLLFGCSNEPQNSEIPQATPTAPVAVKNNASSTPTEPSTTPLETSTEVQSKVAPKEPATASVASVDGAALYTQKCASCHGVKAEKSALNKSQIIAEFSETQVREALKGYQTGTYGKEMKGVMQGQTKGLSDAQIDALAAHIATL
ncbi:MAG: c-type cytochrome [Sulfuricurvum sp.]|nr:c-type cytochrome [Campylobacterota bacterium]MBD3805974.1 c-type cytochrome [Sulfuricurvum sp.]